jgi:thiamine biosynthesis lipoprotein
MIHLLNHPDLQTCSCEAMHTTFTLHLVCPDAAHAADAASACFNQLDMLESHLSRFRHDSDVSRINQLCAGDTLLISEDTYACLMQAFEACAMTGGLFDVTLGSATWPEDCAPDTVTGDIIGQLELAPDQPLVTCHEAGRQVDLGGIGKGFALDQLAGTLAAYRIDSALLCAGASTMLAIGDQAWPVALTGDSNTKQIGLQGCALSASGTGIQGAHVVHPDFPGEEPPYIFKRTWLTAPSAALADACSTACLLMADDEIDAFAETHRRDMTIHVEEIDDTEIRTV